MNRRQWGLAVIAIGAVAVSLRLGSLFWSPLPYNPDGIFYAAWARDALVAGHLPLDRLATDSLGFTTWLATIGHLTGESPLYVAQLASGVVGATTVLFAMVLARRIAPAGWPASRRRLAVLVAGLLLAVDGLYVYRSMATDETTAGLLLLPMFAVVVGRALVTSDRRWVVVGIPIVASVPPLHNHDGILVALVLTAAVGYALLRRITVRRVLGAGIATGITWAWMVGYHPIAAILTPTRVIQTGRLRDAPGLFVAWIVLALVAVGWFATTSRRLRRGTLATFVGGLFFVVVLNSVRVVFPGTMSTSPALLAMLLPLAVPALLATVGADRLVRRSGGGLRLGTLALIAGPATMIGFALTAGLTPVNLATAFRTQLYLHLPLVALAAVVLVRGVGRRRGWRSLPLKSVAIGGLVVCGAVSIPIAFTGLEYRPYETITTPAEFRTTEFATTHLDGSWATDDHLARVAGYHRPNNSVSGRAGWLRPGGATETTPAFEWLRDGAPPPTCPVVLQQSWTWMGAQFYPNEPVPVDGAWLSRWTRQAEVVYAAGSPDPLRIVLPATAKTPGC